MQSVQRTHLRTNGRDFLKYCIIAIIDHHRIQQYPYGHTHPFHMFGILQGKRAFYATTMSGDQDHPPPSHPATTNNSNVKYLILTYVSPTGRENGI